MAFTLAQLKEKHAGTTAKRVFALEDIKKEAALRAETAGQQFEREKPTGFFGKARDVAASIVGGGKIAIGAAQARVAPEILETFTEEQRQTEELQNKILTRIREKREAGEDVSRLEKTLKTSQDLATTLQDVQKDFEESLVTRKEVLGSALRLAGTATGGVLTKTLAKSMALGRATTFAGGALRGAGVGAATGGILGGVHGAGVGLEREEDLIGTLKTSATGAIMGAATGGVLGAITGGISGTLRGKKITRENFSKNLVSPKETAKVRAEAISKGRLEDPGFLKKATLRASERDKLLANSVDDVVSQKATIGENVDAIRLKVTNTNNGVKDFIAKNKVPFNTRQLNFKLLEGKNDLRLIFASDATAEKTYNAVTKEFMRNVAKKDTSGLFNARQDFDQIPAIKKLLQTEGLAENTRREIVLAVRGKANEYVASLLPKGNTFRADLLREHYMLEALGNLSEKTAAIIGKNKIQLMTQEYPMLKWVLGGVAGSVATLFGLRLAGGVGAGGSVIGSSD